MNGDNRRRAPDGWARRTLWHARADAPAAELLRRLERETIVPRPLDETFAFFADAANLSRLTPPWIDFRIETPLPIGMAAGVEIDYQIVLHGIPIPWRTRIDVWEPGRRFVDRQLLGPYWWWHHEHLFEAVDEGTRVIDRVAFLPRFRRLTGAWVQRDVERIFDYRHEVLPQLLRAPDDGQR